jgi:hypothetical protein
VKKTALYEFHVQHGGNVPIIFYDVCSKTALPRLVPRCCRWARFV